MIYVYLLGAVLVMAATWVILVLNYAMEPADLEDFALIALVPIVTGVLWPLAAVGALLWVAGQALWHARYGHTLTADVDD